MQGILAHVANVYRAASVAAQEDLPNGPNLDVASLLLARAEACGRETAVRAALGAGRLRVLRQLLTESAVRTVVSAVAGVALA